MLSCGTYSIPLYSTTELPSVSALFTVAAAAVLLLLLRAGASQFVLSYACRFSLYFSTGFPACSSLDVCHTKILLNCM